MPETNRWPARAVVLALLLLLSMTATGAGPAPEEVVSPTGIRLIRLAPGSFLMGSPPTEPGRDGDERQHPVTLTRGFLLGKTEVTQKQWRAVMGTDPAKLKGDDLPVEQVSWRDCVTFCNTLSKLEGLPPAYHITDEEVVWNRSAAGYRLPTEAEWEYACRAGTTTPHAGDLDEMAVYSSNSDRKTRPVGTRRPNAWGLHDMHGNVWEWCWDGYRADYGPDRVVDPVGPTGEAFKVERGGSWHRNPRDCRSASRNADGSGARRNGLGFRPARWDPADPMD